MSLLGSVGSFYMLILIMLLIIGFGLTGLWILNFILNPQTKNKNQNAGRDKNTMQWLRLALFSFAGIIVSVIILTMLTRGNVSSMH